MLYYVNQRMSLGRVGVYNGALAVKEQNDSAGSNRNRGYLAIAVMASLILSFIILGGTISPAEAAKKSSPGHAPPANTTAYSDSENKSKVENLAVSESDQQPSLPPEKIGSKVISDDDKETVTTGDTQTIYAAVIGEDHKPVPNAVVYATVFFGKNIEKKFTGTTQDDGTVSFSWNIGKHDKTGLVGIDFKAESEGYDIGYGSLVFKYRA